MCSSTANRPGDQPGRAARARHRLSRSAGVTLIELMFVVALVTIVAGLAAPNMINVYRGAALSAEGRYLYSAFIEAKGLAAAEGVRHRLFFDHTNKQWLIQTDTDNDTNWDDVAQHPKGGESWPSYVSFGPVGGVPTNFDIPYAGWDRDEWCTNCDADSDDFSIIIDTDGRVTNAAGNVINGVVMIHDPTGGLGGVVHAILFVGATGEIRLFKTTE